MNESTTSNNQPISCDTNCVMDVRVMINASTCCLLTKRSTAGCNNAVACSYAFVLWYKSAMAARALGCGEGGIIAKPALLVLIWWLGTDAGAMI